jgi:hypothetical protein
LAVAAAEAGGNSVWVLHDNGTIAAYFYLCQGCVMVAVNQDVVAGEILGLAGDSSASAGPHLEKVPDLLKQVPGQQTRHFFSIIGRSKTGR